MAIHASLRWMCPQGRGGSTPLVRTKMAENFIKFKDFPQESMAKELADLLNQHGIEARVIKDSSSGNAFFNQYGAPSPLGLMSWFVMIPEDKLEEAGKVIK